MGDASLYIFRKKVCNSIVQGLVSYNIFLFFILLFSIFLFLFSGNRFVGAGHIFAGAVTRHYKSNSRGGRISCS
jgi:hypothetical protein